MGRLRLVEGSPSLRNNFFMIKHIIAMVLVTSIRAFETGKKKIRAYRENRIILSRVLIILLF
jgi:hypothetical protein